jgi:uncharacterized membrane protein
MFFLPIGCLALILFILFLPVLFFRILSFGFEKLGFSPEATFLILFLILVGSVVNIPLTRKKAFYIERPRFFGLFKKPQMEAQGITINLGGAVIPLCLSAYFLTKVSLEPVLIATILMTIISYHLARVIPGRGIALPAFIPPIFSALFALILAPGFAAPCAFISGVLGTLIGADVLNLRKVQRISPGMLSIGGAGVFDGIFLIGIVSAFLASL